tara:strand:- start:144 stop:812 length:669 start_codon:yes stop_codon:yes gene_type:complete
MGLKLGNLKCGCCGDCDLCGNGKLPNSLNLIITDAVDYDCASVAAVCDNDPSPMSPFSSLNGTHVLNYSSTLTAAAGDPCIAWYESGPISYGDYLGSPVGFPTCNIRTGATVTFAAELVFLGSPGTTPRVALYSYVGTDSGTRLYFGVADTEETEDMDWLCDSGITSDEWVNGGIDVWGTTSDDTADAYYLRYSGGGGTCYDDVLATPFTIQMSRSAGEFTP